MRILISCVILVFSMHLPNDAQAQVSSEEKGVRISIIGEDIPEYWHGEPFWIYIDAYGESSFANGYYKPDLAINCRVTLKNHTTGETSKMNNNYWRMGQEDRDRQQRDVGDSRRKFSKGKHKYIPINMARSFGQEPDNVRPILSRSNLRHNIKLLSAGSYELMVEFFLYPGKSTIKVTYPFRVLALPQNERDIFQEYIKCVKYAIRTGYWGSNTYDENAGESYERFLTQHSNSLFAKHALMDMVTKVYLYPVAPDKVRKKKFALYSKSYGKIDQRTLKLQYASFLPRVLMLKNGDDPVRAQGELDEFLSKSSVDFATSSMVIDIAKRQHGITGLKSYVKKK